MWPSTFRGSKKLLSKPSRWFSSTLTPYGDRLMVQLRALRHDEGLENSALAAPEKVEGEGLEKPALAAPEKVGGEPDPAP